MSPVPSASPGGTLSGRIAIVTGASAGIGEAIARDFHAHGASIVINARRAEKLEQLAAYLGSRVAAVPGDAAEDSTITAMLDTARTKFGGGTREADLIIINAGRGLGGTVITSDISQWEEMIRTNVLAAAKLIRAAGQRLLKEQEGKQGEALLDRARDIIVLGSTVGRHVSPFSSMYGGTKFNVHGMVEGVRREIGPKGIRVSLIEPGFVVSEFQGVAGYDDAWLKGVWDRIGPVLKPEDVARTVSFIAQQPPAVHINDIMIRPTRQDYP
ncbi:MAG: SDR family oxidoreductase [Phycisphaeraceae bacterium]|nr:SDR family oxidoreductase [Phycisphaeraceae bacterium]